MASQMLSMHLRGLFSQSSSDGSSSSSTNHTCPLPNPLKETPTDPVKGNYTFHNIATIISGSAAGFAILSIFILMFRHATHFSRPNEQLKILRICLLIPVASLIQFIGQVVPVAYFYILPWADMMQALALANFFLLLLEFISPHETQRDFFFSGLQVPAKRSGRPPRDGLRWYRRKWIAIFQYPVVQFLVSVATDVTQSPKLNIYCENSNKPYFAHLWLNLIHVLSTLTAVISCLRFYKILKVELTGHKPLSKLFAFKLLVGLNILMNVIFWILNDIKSSPLEPSSTMNEADVSVGIPATVNCLILVPFSVFFHYAYDVGPYIIDRHSHSGPERGESHQYHQHYQGGFLGTRAFVRMLDPREILGAIGFMFKMRGRSGRGQSGNGNASAANGYNTVTSTDGRDAGPAHQMSRRDQRRVDKHIRGDHSRGSGERNGQAAPYYGWTNSQNGGNGNGQPQHGYR